MHRNLKKHTFGFLGGLLTLVAVAGTAYAKPQPAWDNQINNPARFQVLKQFNDEAVLDKETGLVWERSPSPGTPWVTALSDCYNKNVGGRKGWRLPTIEELMSLVDTTQFDPALPSGNPFTNLPVFFFYWSSTTVAGGGGGLAWDMNLSDGSLDAGNKLGFLIVWCVRGGNGRIEGDVLP